MPTSWLWTTCVPSLALLSNWPCKRDSLNFRCRLQIGDMPLCWAASSCNLAVVNELCRNEHLADNLVRPLRVARMSSSPPLRRACNAAALMPLCEGSRASFAYWFQEHYATKALRKMVRWAAGMNFSLERDFELTFKKLRSCITQVRLQPPP